MCCFNVLNISKNRHTEVKKSKKRLNYCIVLNELLVCAGGICTVFMTVFYISPLKQINCIINF